MLKSVGFCAKKGLIRRMKVEYRVYIDKVTLTCLRVIAEIEDRKTSAIMKDAFEEWAKKHNYTAVLDKVKQKMNCEER